MHVVLHEPQLLPSVSVSRQKPPQLVSGAGQPLSQRLAQHTGLPPEQTVLQPPQWLGSMLVTVQTPPQSVCPTGHWQTPA